jgi:hypothetical protein
MSGDEPIIWCLLGRKAGDNTQVLALADELGLPYMEKRIFARPWELLTHLSLRVTLAGIDRRRSSLLAGPWPDLIITAGRRNEPVAQWIREQASGKTRIVQIGRPWAPLDCYDLIVTTPQYFLPGLPNILHNELPLNRLLPARLVAAADGWRHRFRELPRPWIAVLIGGDSGRFVFTGRKGARLGRLCDRLADAAGGSLLVTNSPRTPAYASDAFRNALKVPYFEYQWSQGWGNPYLAYLALADAFVVTGESMSMLAEAASTGKPLYVFDTGDGDQPWWRLRHNYRYKPLSHHLAMALGPRRMRRDIGRIQSALVNNRRAIWLGEASRLENWRLDAGEGQPAAEGACRNLARRELELTAHAVRRLLTPR